MQTTSRNDLCGTQRGYGRHLKHGEPSCDDCRAAHATYNLRRRSSNPTPLPRCACGRPIHKAGRDECSRCRARGMVAAERADVPDPELEATEVQWERRGMVYHPVRVVDPQPDTQYRREQ